MNTQTTAPSQSSRFFKVEITKATLLCLGNTLVNPFYEKMVGKKVFVRQPNFNSAYYETKSGNSILRWDCKRVSK